MNTDDLISDGPAFTQLHVQQSFVFTFDLKVMKLNGV